MPPRVSTPSLTDFLNQAASRAMSGVDPGVELAALKGSTVNAWDDEDMVKWEAPVASAKDTIPGAPTGLFQRRSTYVSGDENADRAARLNDIDPYSAGWLDVARSQLGAPYTWATANPKGAAGGPGSGFDCSGFTQWVYKRAFGINLPHFSQAQDQMSQNVGREDLRPGDLLFFSYGRLGTGAVDDVQIYVGNGQMIGASSTLDAIAIRDVNWSNFVRGGRIAGADTGAVARKTRVAQPGQRGKSPEATVSSGIAKSMTGGENWLLALEGPAAAAHTAATAAVRMANEAEGVSTPSFGSGTKAEIEEQLYRGFMDAGKPELAKMVGTKAFNTWIGAESGWRVDAVSPSFPGHGRNYGLFQFWEGHSWTDPYYTSGAWTMSAYDQARMVVRYFNLTPKDIRNYAAQINNDTYGGWG